MLFWNIRHNKWSLKNMKWTGECLPTSPQLCPHRSGDVSPRCAEPRAGICHHRLAELSQQFWISSPASVLGRQSGGLVLRDRSRTPRVRWDLQLCLPWELGLVCHGNRQEQRVQEWGTALLMAGRDQGSATDLCEISHHQMIFYIQICSREHIPSGSNLGKFREKGYKQICLQHNVFLASIQPIPLV